MPEVDFHIHAHFSSLDLDEIEKNFLCGKSSRCSVSAADNKLFQRFPRC